MSKGISDRYRSSVIWATVVYGLCAFIFTVAALSFRQEARRVETEIFTYRYGSFFPSEQHRRELQQKAESIRRQGEGLTYFGLVIAVLAVYVMVAFLVTLYKAWVAIQDGHASIGPRMAIALLFIPLLNLVWVFFAVPGFVAEYNRYIARNELRVTRLSKKPFIVFAVLLALSIVPLVGYVTALVGPVYACILVSRMSDAIDDLPELPKLERKQMEG